MASHNTKPDFVFHKKPQQKITENTPEFVNLALQDDDLSIDDDSDIGGDPYNSTGQNVVLKQRKRRGG